MNDAWNWIKSHPWIIGGLIFVVGLWWIMSRSGGSGATDAGLAAAYYGAVSADRTSVTNQIIAQTNANAAVSLAEIQYGAGERVQSKWADTQLAMVNSNNAALPYRLASQYVETLGYVAAQPGTVTTKKNSGFFGIGGGTKQVYTPNPHALAASEALTDLDFLQGFLPGH